MQKQLESMDKDQVRNMLSAFGQKPSEAEVNRIINRVESTKKKNKISKTKGKK
jgi:uncharacterized protein YneF (UPF0154 family)